MTDKKEDFRGFDDLSVEEVEKFKNAMGLSTSINDSYEWWNQFGRYLEMRKGKAKGVFIKTACGEEHHVKPSQAVSEIYVDGEQVYPAPHTPDKMENWRIVHKNEGFIVKSLRHSDEYHFQYESNGWITTEHEGETRGLDAMGGTYDAELVK